MLFELAGDAKPYTLPGVPTSATKKPAACNRKLRVGTASCYRCSTEYARSIGSSVGQTTPSLCWSRARSNLSPGLKSDILSGKTDSNEPQPPASSHIVQSTRLRICGHNTPVPKLAPIYNTANLLKLQVLFSKNSKNFFVFFRRHKMLLWSRFSPQMIETFPAKPNATHPRGVLLYTLL